jgi:phage protein D
MTDYLAPNFAIKVADSDIDVGVRKLITSVEYESTDGMADIMRIKAINPDFKLSDSRVFAPGNEMSLWIGYGEQLSHIGRVKIYKNSPNFPQTDWPTFEAVGYTRDHDMMHKQPEASTSGSSNTRGRGRQRGGRRFRNIKYSEAVRERAYEYTFRCDIDETPEEPTDFIQKVGMSDYDFVKGLANLTGFYLWVDGDEDGYWTLHFRNPETYDGDQEKKYNFEYNNGNLSTLLTFEPDFLITGAVSRIKAQIRHYRTGRLLTTEFQEDNLDSPDVLLDSAGSTGEGTSNVPEIEEAPTTSTAVQIFIGDYSFQEIANRRFRAESELIAWVRQWFRRQRENFILSNGKSIGLETVKARQIHQISNVGTVYSGDYFFSRVKHKLDDSEGYTLDFSCRKQVPQVS